MKIFYFLNGIYRRLVSIVNDIVKGEGDFEKAKAVVPFFYYLLFFIAFSHLEGLNHIIAEGGSGFAPRWPIFWARALDYGTVVTIILVGSTATALLAALFPYARFVRFIAFLGLFSYHAYMSSFGGPMHQWDHLLWVAFIFIFLPFVTPSASSETRRTFSLVFWGAQAFMLLTYSMAGFGKIVYGFIQFFGGQAHVFSPDAGALHIATLLTSMGETMPLGELIVEYPLLGWLPFLAILYLQLFSVAVAFRPPLHRVWGGALILFHLGTFLTMRAVFTVPSALLLVLFLASPFAPATTSWREIVRNLPFTGTVSKIFLKAKQS